MTTHQINLHDFNPSSKQSNVPLTIDCSALPSPEFDITTLTKFPPFKSWLSSLTASLTTQYSEPAHPFHSSPYSITSITVQSIDWKGPYKGPTSSPLFVKLKADIKNDKDETLPGIVLLRGGSVGMLVILRDIETGEEWVPLTVQPRVAVGQLDLVELPAGMLDGDNNFAGVAAKELQEECGITVKNSELIDLGGEALGKEKSGLFPSGGGCDESIRLYACLKELSKKDIESLKGKMGELWKEGEKITLKVVRLEDLWRETQDFKALAAWALYKGLKDKGKIPW